MTSSAIGLLCASGVLPYDILVLTTLPLSDKYRRLTAVLCRAPKVLAMPQIGKHVRVVSSFLPSRWRLRTDAARLVQVNRPS